MMRDAGLKIGCQTFTWEMLGKDWAGTTDEILEAISAAGYSGLEITDNMIGPYADRPTEFAARLNDLDLTLVAFAFASDTGFTKPDSISDDLAATQRWLEFIAHFPNAVASMGSATQIPGTSREDGFDVAAEVYNRAAALAAKAGVDLAIHPSSHENTLLFDRHDYAKIFDRLDPIVGWVPDTGHILRGGMHPATVMSDYLDRIRYLHLKDVDSQGTWQMLGSGVCNIKETFDCALNAPGFNGWVIVEEESKTAHSDPGAAVAKNYSHLTAD